MALTDLQKAQNHAASLVRNRAHAARVRQFHEAVEAAKDAPEVMKARRAADSADAACEKATLERDNEIRRLQEQIDALNKQILKLRSSEKIEALVAARRAKNTEWNSLRQAEVLAAKARFQDLADSGRFSAAAWTPPQEVLDAMEAARRAATVAPAKPKAKSREACRPTPASS